MKRRLFIKKALLTSLAGITGVSTISAFPKPAISQNIKRWSMTTTWPKNFPGLGTGANMLAETITKASGGRLEIKVFGAGEIVPAMDAINAVSSGTVEMGHGAPYYWKGKVPAAQFLACTPFGLNAQEQNAWLEFGGGQELADKIYADMNCKFFASGNTGVQMGGWYNKEIKTIEDYKGLKMRMPGLGGEVTKAAGATVVGLSGGEILPAMQSGAIDATEWNGPYNDLSFGLHKVAKHYYFPGWHEPGVIIDSFINLDSWNELDDDLQVIIKSATQYANARVLNEYTARNGSSLNKLKKEHNIKPKAFSPEMLSELHKLSKTVISDIAAQDGLSQKVFDSIQGFQTDAMEWSNISEKAFMIARS